jgi:AhpD family alkylhydroperoxidase
MMQRLDFAKASPAAYKALLGVENYVRDTGLEHSLLELVKLRASQINGCGFCVDMHARDARKAGEDERRLYAVAAWRETPFFSPRERAALAWTEAVTRLGEARVPDAVYAQVRAQFTDAELVYLTLAVTAINSWNRMNIAFRVEAGGYQPGMFKRAMGQ